MGDESQTYLDAAQILTRGEGHRVWSLIVTIFGDLARAEGDRISGAVLTRLAGLMGVKPEAMRVALHRLRKDGWIDSAREGRTSLHYLTRVGREQSAAVSPRIYARERRLPDLWHLLVAGDQTGRGRLESFLLAGDYLPIGPQVVMGPGRLPGDLNGLLGVEARGWSVPAWLQEQVCPHELLEQYRGLQQDLARVMAALPRPTGLSVLERAALRALAVHSWRRLLLRHPDLPEGFFPAGWPGRDCRRLFCDLIDLLPAPSTADLESALMQPDSEAAGLPE